MSISLVAAAFKADVPAVPKLVLLALADSANEEDGGCWFLIKTLSRKTSLEERAVRRNIYFLQESGFLSYERRPGRSSLFFLSLSKLGLEAHSSVSHTPGVKSGTPGSKPGTPGSKPGTPGSKPDISVSYPSLDSLNNPLKPEARKALTGTLIQSRRPEAGGFGEGGAKAPPLGVRAPERGRGGSTAKPSFLHVSSEPELARSPDECRANLARLRASLLGALS